MKTHVLVLLVKCLVPLMALTATSCIGLDPLTADQKLPTGDPEALFRAYSTYLMADQYAGVLECLTPELRPSSRRAMIEMKLSRARAALLKDEITARYGAAYVQEFQRKVDGTANVFRLAFQWPNEGFDWDSAEYKERQGVVVATGSDDRTFGLVAIQRGEQWYLAYAGLGDLTEDMRMLSHLLGEFRRFMDRLHADVSSGSLGRDEFLARLRGSGW